MLSHGCWTAIHFTIGHIRICILNERGNVIVSNVYIHTGLSLSDDEPADLSNDKSEKNSDINSSSYYFFISIQLPGAANTYIIMYKKHKTAMIVFML